MPTIDRQHELLKFQLRCLGWTVSNLSDELGVSKGFISRVLSGQARSARIEAFVANKLGTDPSKLWPQNFQTNGGSNANIISR